MVTHNAFYHLLGLDPAGPEFTSAGTCSRLAPSDAKLVHVYHTNGAAFGSTTRMGHLDVFVNGGLWQPFCSKLSTCSHHAATEIFIRLLENELATMKHMNILRKIGSMDTCRLHDFLCDNEPTMNSPGTCSFCYGANRINVCPKLGLMSMEAYSLSRFSQRYFASMKNPSENNDNGECGSEFFWSLFAIIYVNQIFYKIVSVNAETEFFKLVNGWSLWPFPETLPAWFFWRFLTTKTNRNLGNSPTAEGLTQKLGLCSRHPNHFILSPKLRFLWITTLRSTVPSPWITSCFRTLTDTGWLLLYFVGQNESTIVLKQSKFS